ncbi:hypothetical protein [Sorangium sp. So ce1389]
MPPIEPAPSRHTAPILKRLLLFRGGKSVVIVNTPFYLHDTPKTA